ncbi:MAG TPA: hypothetical protein PLP05_07380, partial [Sedimentisphaerales bacterium]|nr:hypothetical protein [Sedimentisphaerales bacterium]
ITLIEMLAAVIILLILITLTATIGKRIEQQTEERLTRETIALIDTALGEFGEFGYQYKNQKYINLKFPLDCNDFDTSEIATALKEALGYSDVSVTLTSITSDENKIYSGCEVMYFILNMVPASRAALDEIDQSLILKTGTVLINTNDNEEQPLMRIEDAWGKTLHYSYYDNGTEVQPGNNLDEPTIDKHRSFPIITSAGQDTKFGTNDDITNR